MSEFDKNEVDKFFTQTEQVILSSKWGESRMQQLTRGYNKSRGNDPFKKISIYNLKHAVDCAKQNHFFQWDDRAEGMACDGRMRASSGMDIVRTVLREGLEKTAEQLSRPVVREVCSQNARLIGNPEWQKLQAAFNAHNAITNDPCDHIEVEGVDELSSYLQLAEVAQDVANAFVGVDVPLLHLPHIKKAMTVAAIVHKCAPGMAV